MKRLGTLLAIALGATLFLALIALPANAKTLALGGPVVSVGHGVTIDVWTDREEGAIYRPGDEINIYFYAAADCYVTIYDIDTDGNVQILFPEYPDDGFVYGGTTYRLPDYYSRRALYVTGDRGIEYIHAVATETPGAFRYRSYNGRYMAGIDPITGDPFVAINSINNRIISHNLISDVATTWFFVGARVWYPRYMCASCHGRTISFNPYTAECPRYSVHIAGTFDYWWGYQYYPVRTRFVFAGPFWRFEIRTAPHRYRSVRYIDIAYGYHNYYCRKAPRRPYHHVPIVTAHTTVLRERTSAYRPVTYKEVRTGRTAGDRNAVTGEGPTSRSRSATTGTRQESATTTTRTRTDYDVPGRSLEVRTQESAAEQRSSTSTRTSTGGTTSTRTETRTSADDYNTRAVNPPPSSAPSSRTPQHTETETRTRTTTMQVQTSRIPSASSSERIPSRSASSSRSTGSDSRSRQQSSSSSSSSDRTRTR